MTDDIAYKTPIADLLADIPEDARQMYEHHPTHHQNIPFGRLAKEALEEIESLRRERDRLLRIANEFSTSLVAGPSATIDFTRLSKADDEFMELLESRKALKGETE